MFVHYVKTFVFIQLFTRLYLFIFFKDEPVQPPSDYKSNLSWPIVVIPANTIFLMLKISYVKIYFDLSMPWAFYCQVLTMKP